MTRLNSLVMLVLLTISVAYSLDRPPDVKQDATIVATIPVIQDAPAMSVSSEGYLKQEFTWQDSQFAICDMRTLEPLYLLINTQDGNCNCHRSDKELHEWTTGANQIFTSNCTESAESYKAFYAMYTDYPLLE